MRCNQVTISIERFGEYVPKDYPADVQRIHVYCDDFKSIYAALSKAYALAINELAEYENIGVRTDVYTNEFSRADYRKMNGALLETRRKYEDDVNLEYHDTNIQLCEDRIWVYENAEAIMAVLRECDDKNMIEAKLKDTFGLDNYQIRKLSQMRFDMLTKKDYADAKAKIALRKAELNSDERQAEYSRIKKADLLMQIEKLKAYFALLEHFEEISHLLLETESEYDLEEMLQDKLGISRHHASMFKYFELSEFSKKEQKHKRKMLEVLERHLEIYL